MEKFGSDSLTAQAAKIVAATWSKERQEEIQRAWRADQLDGVGRLDLFLERELNDSEQQQIHQMRERLEQQDR